MLPASGRDLVKFRQWAAMDWISQTAHSQAATLLRPLRGLPLPLHRWVHTHTHGTHAWHTCLGKCQLMSVLWTKGRLPAPPNACAHIWLQGCKAKCLLHGDHPWPKCLAPADLLGLCCTASS